MRHLFAFQNGVFSPDGKVDVPASDVDAMNAEHDRAELAYWKTAPEWFAPVYYDFPAEHARVQSRIAANVSGVANPYRQSFSPLRESATVKTWLGTPLGPIVSARVYRHNFGGRFVALTVRGTNGARYTGRASWDNGNVIRLRKVRS